MSGTNASGGGAEAWGDRGERGRTAPLPDTAFEHRAETVRDALTAFWLLLWLVVGVLIGIQVWSLSSVSSTARSSARAVDDAGRALQGLSGLPLVGQQTAEVGNQMRAAAHDVRVSAAQTRTDVRRLSVLLGFSVALVPATPLIALYLPGRWARRRRLREIEAALKQHGLDPRLEAYLAHRAVHELGYADLSAVSSDPVADLREGRHRALAEAELARLGLHVIVPPRSEHP